MLGEPAPGETRADLVTGGLLHPRAPTMFPCHPDDRSPSPVDPYRRQTEDIRRTLLPHRKKVRISVIPPLTRFNERKLFAVQGTLRSLVLDEVHAYTGRRRADIAALICR